jgi:hypothetical protein
MKTTRPVFESFSAFVNNLYEMESQYPGFLDSLNEAFIEDSLLKGKTVELPDILARLENSSIPVEGERCTRFLQTCASLNPIVETKLKEIGKVLNELGAKSWISPESELYVGGAYSDPFFKSAEQIYYFVNGDIVQVDGAPAEDCATIVKESQFISYKDLCGRVAAYNASVCVKSFKITLDDINKKGEVKRAVSGDADVKWWKKLFSLGFMQDINMDSALAKDCLFIYCQGENEVIACTKVRDLPDSVKEATITSTKFAGSDATWEYGQFRYLFPVVSDIRGGTKLLSIKNRQELVKVDKSKETVPFDDQINVTSDEKTNYYNPNVADLSDAGKIAVIGVINQFAKIDKIVVLGSADHREPTGWKDNTALATARRDETIKFIDKLSTKDGLSISGVNAEAGEVSVQPKDGSKDPKELQNWRAVKLKITGQIYKDINDLLPKGDEFVTMEYTDKKKASVITFNNSMYCFRLNTENLASKKDRANLLKSKKVEKSKKNDAVPQAGPPAPKS